MNPVPAWICGLLFTKSWRIYLHFRHIQIFAFGLEISPTNVTVISQNRNIYSPETSRFMPEKPGRVLLWGKLPGAFVSRKLYTFLNVYTTPCLRVGFFKKSSFGYDDFFSFLSADSSANCSSRTSALPFSFSVRLLYNVSNSCSSFISILSGSSPDIK